MLFLYLDHIRDNKGIDIGILFEILDIRREFEDSAVFDMIGAVRYRKGELDDTIQRLVPSLFYLENSFRNDNLQLPLKVSVEVREFVKKTIQDSHHKIADFVDITSGLFQLEDMVIVTEEEQKVARELIMELVQAIDKKRYSAQETEMILRPLIKSIR